MQPFMENFGEYLKHLCEDHVGITLDQLSDAAEMSEGRLQEIVRENKPIFAHEAFRLAQALEMSVSELLGDPNTPEGVIFEQMGEEQENRTSFYSMIWLPHNLAPNSLETIHKYASPLPKKKSILYELELRHVATTQEVETMYKDYEKSVSAPADEEDLPEIIMGD
jgi:transcriptional regulator with XRE-family HTH domain